MNSKSYDAECKTKVLDLIENGENAGDVAWEYDVPLKTIRRWADEGARNRRGTYTGKTRPDREERMGGRR